MSFSSSARPPRCTTDLRNVFVAGFMGSPGMTLFETQVVADDGLSIAVSEDRISIDEDELRSQPAVADRVGQNVIAGIRAEDLTLGRLDGLRRTFRAELRFQEQLGSSLIAYFSIRGLTQGGAIDDALEQRLTDDSAPAGAGAATRRTSSPRGSPPTHGSRSDHPSSWGSWRASCGSSTQRPERLCSRFG